MSETYIICPDCASVREYYSAKDAGWVIIGYPSGRVFTMCPTCARRNEVRVEYDLVRGPQDYNGVGEYISAYAAALVLDELRGYDDEEIIDLPWAFVIHPCDAYGATVRVGDMRQAIYIGLVDLEEELE